MLITVEQRGEDLPGPLPLDTRVSKASLVSNNPISCQRLLLRTEARPLDITDSGSPRAMGQTRAIIRCITRAQDVS